MTTTFETLDDVRAACPLYFAHTGYRTYEPLYGGTYWISSFDALRADKITQMFCIHYVVGNRVRLATDHDYTTIGRARNAISRLLGSAR